MQFDSKAETNPWVTWFEKEMLQMQDHLNEIAEII